MIDHDRLEHWTTCMVQAQNFAARENYQEACARCRVVRDEVQAAVRTEKDTLRRARLERYLGRIENQLSRLEAQYYSWNEAIAVQRQATIDAAPEEMARPLPMPANAEDTEP